MCTQVREIFYQTFRETHTDKGENTIASCLGGRWEQRGVCLTGCNIFISRTESAIHVNSNQFCLLQNPPLILFGGSCWLDWMAPEWQQCGLLTEDDMKYSAAAQRQTDCEVSDCAAQERGCAPNVPLASFCVWAAGRGMRWRQRLYSRGKKGLMKPEGYH